MSWSNLFLAPFFKGLNVSCPLDAEVQPSLYTYPSSNLTPILTGSKTEVTFKEHTVFGGRYNLTLSNLSSRNDCQLQWLNGARWTTCDNSMIYNCFIVQNSEFCVHMLRGGRGLLRSRVRFIQTFEHSEILQLF